MFSTLPTRAVALAVFASLLAATGCSGGGSSGSVPVPNTAFCGSDTSYALARPLNGQSIQNGTSTIEIVANGSNNQINASFQNFNLFFVPANNNGSLQGQVTTGPLARSSDPGGFAPFGSNFYYSGTLQSPGLAPGTVYNVYVNAFTSNCTPVGPIGQLGTF
ncbi:MAG: hypothetical protein NVS2B8_08770 [Vulcanimicrobiaceae bacterium]